MAKKKAKATKAAKATNDYPYDAVTSRDALLQGPDIVIPAGTSIQVHGERDGLGVVSTTVGDAVRAGLMRKSAYRRA